MQRMLDTLLPRNFVSALSLNSSSSSGQPISTEQNTVSETVFLVYVIMDWREKKQRPTSKKKMRICKVGKIFTAACVFYVSTLRLYISTESWKNVRLELRRMSASFYVYVYVICCLVLPVTSRNVDDTLVINLKLYNYFILKIFTLCVVKCSPSVTYVSVASLCQRCISPRKI